MSLSEADTRSKLIDPALYARGWTEDLIRREETAGSIAFLDGMSRNKSRGRADDPLWVEVKAARQQGRLIVHATHLEAGASTREVVPALAAELKILAGWLGLDEIVRGD